MATRRRAGDERRGRGTAGDGRGEPEAVPTVKTAAGRRGGEGRGYEKETLQRHIPPLFDGALIGVDADNGSKAHGFPAVEEAQVSASLGTPFAGSRCSTPRCLGACRCNVHPM
ncbi:hypothetical protein [Oryza sativa Japonica Group]|uniref:Uncharacterized protein n=1 Tax=Oryza sativa subsp. japonica TaxID=39947 RepID=Q5JLX8_ORYSJ|nr:hypothetical protein [Oryza sativa Japonica Group]